jgi:hypothetical protein
VTNDQVSAFAWPGYFPRITTPFTGSPRFNAGRNGLAASCPGGTSDAQIVSTASRIQVCRNVSDLNKPLTGTDAPTRSAEICAPEVLVPATDDDELPPEHPEPTMPMQKTPTTGRTRVTDLTAGVLPIPRRAKPR